MYERNIKNKLDIIKSKEEAGDIKKEDPNKSFEVENFSDGKRKTQIAEERKRKAKMESLRAKKVETGINFTMETRLVKSILSTNSRINLSKPNGAAVASSRMSFYSNSKRAKEKARNIHMTNSMHRGGVRSSYSKSRIGSAFPRGEALENTSTKPVRPTTAIAHNKNKNKNVNFKS